MDDLNKRKIASNDSTPGNPYVGKDDRIFLLQLLLAFGLGYARLVDSKKSDGKQKVKENKAGSNAHTLASQDKWKTMKYNKLPNRQPYDIQTVLEK